VSQRQTPQTRFEGEAVFVGHGITAPEWKWDDFKGVDVKGKVLVLFTNEPASNDAAFFEGRALTYYGRWTYKYEEAVRRGAVGAILIHTTPTAGYGWEVVRNSWGREVPFVKLAAGEPALAFQGWVTREAGRSCWPWPARPWMNFWRLPRSATSSQFRWESASAAACPPGYGRSIRATWRPSCRAATPS